MEFFRAEKISDRITRIFGVYREMMYLIEGDDKALLLDAGIGVGDLAAFVKTLTSKPVEVIVTHGHMDHTGGAPLFETVYMNAADLHISKDFSDNGTKAAIVKSITGITLTDDDFVVQTPVDYKSLEEGDTFDLGGVTVEMLALPGHTPGMICPLIVEERAVLLGDGCNPTVFLFVEEALSVADYREQLLRFKESHWDKFDAVYLSHMLPSCDKVLLTEVVEVCDDILNRNVDDMPFEFLGKTYQIAKSIDPTTLRRIDGKLGNIIYNVNTL